ncbi:Outer membrane receptor proteins, mostly Fe transport [Flavobacterium omnivorum]|uniref:Outer membrane receptor proteins, mostly Fe transport n=1 Tax=Flavobacterium omnivorum TaxID=178355 RepID=A0A1G7WU89_9FLAO|nr:TonB-dependent receptor [Flavobacterium omnivorum]SDG75434.1 Outer membrane receptor proteins, mostly Fe transport [Flavobacterium omnivorum]
MIKFFIRIAVDYSKSITVKRSKNYFTLLVLFCSSIGYSQLSITGKVTNEDEKPLVSVLVSIYSKKNIISNTITDSIGSYSFKNLKMNNYTIIYSYSTLNDSIPLVRLKTDTIINFRLQKANLLDEAIVKYKNPTLTRKIDRLIFNVSDTDIVYGNNIWNVIEKTPLVSSTSDGEIQINGTSGAIVYVNNKRKMLSGTALKNYLGSIPAENLKSIEIITTPPSKYDSEGSAGILNIVFKKNKEEGLIGDLSLSSRQTAVNSQAISNSLNYRKGKLNVFTTAYLSNRNRQPKFSKEILYSRNNNQLENRVINSFNDFEIESPGFNLGSDYQINSKNIIGVLFDYSGSWHNEKRIALRNDYFKNSGSVYVTHNKDELKSKTFSINLNYEKKIDSLGKALTFDLDFLKFISRNNSVSATDMIDQMTNNPLFNLNTFRSSSPQENTIGSFKMDLEYPVNERFSFDIGLKSSISVIDNNLIFENRSSENVWENDILRSNLFKYDENINAVYGLFNHELSSKWSYQIGVRFENTISKGWLQKVKVIDKNYNNIFPTAFLKYATSKDKSYVLAITSRITRPSYWDLNPFRTYTTDETYFEGNPFLLPSKYYRQEISYMSSSSKGTLTIQLATSQTFDEFFSLPSNPTENIISNKKTNYGNKYGFSNTVTYYSQLQPWWKLTSTLLSAFVNTKGSYAENININDKTYLFSVSANQNFTISNQKGLTCSLIVSNTFPNTIVNTHIGNRLETEIRLRKSIGNLNITLSAQDVLKSNKDKYRIQVNDLRITDENYHDTRSVALALSYSFGKSTIKDKRDRETGISDIKNRM